MKGEISIFCKNLIFDKYFMKKMSVIFIVVFFLILLLPVLFFDFREDISSEIDNRKLTNNPLKHPDIVDEYGSLTDALDKYVSDRIGFRNFFIRNYTSLNDKLFDKMVHPIYEYGVDDYVFFVRSTGNKLDYDDFYTDFINMLVNIKDYCDEKKIPFLFVFEPSKSSVLRDKINTGINYENKWLDDFLQEIKDKGIDLVDNYNMLQDKYMAGEKIFNQKYDAGHWNDLGAYYGINNVLDHMKKYFKNIHINDLTDFNKVDLIYDTLSVSEFPIYEKGIEYVPKAKIDDLTNKYSNVLNISKQNNYFKFWTNSSQKNNSPRTMIFQGSYFNGYGYRFLQNSLYEYIAIHNYDNILNFDYYFNIFQPECVIFEVTEYTLSGTYFNKERLKEFDLNPDFSNFNKYEIIRKNCNLIEKKVDINESLTNMVFNNIPSNTSYAYVKINNKLYDLKKQNDETYTLTILTSQVKGNVSVMAVNELDKEVIIYSC